jgi:hypothetical protein
MVSPFSQPIGGVEVVVGGIETLGLEVMVNLLRCRAFRAILFPEKLD